MFFGYDIDEILMVILLLLLLMFYVGGLGFFYDLCVFCEVVVSVFEVFLMICIWFKEWE